MQMAIVDDTIMNDAQHLLRVVSLLYAHDDVNIHCMPAIMMTPLPLIVVDNDTFLTVTNA
jgi:hypothetical protein